MQLYLSIELFITEAKDRLPDVEPLRDARLQSQALEIVSAGSKTFNEGLRKQSTELLAYAKKVFPPVRTSGPWAKVHAKRLIGHSAWQVIRGPVHGLQAGLRKTMP